MDKKTLSSGHMLNELLTNYLPNWKQESNHIIQTVSQKADSFLFSSLKTESYKRPLENHTDGQSQTRMATFL